MHSGADAGVPVHFTAENPKPFGGDSLGSSSSSSTPGNADRDLERDELDEESELFEVESAEPMSASSGLALVLSM